MILVGDDHLSPGVTGFNFSGFATGVFLPQNDSDASALQLGSRGTDPLVRMTAVDRTIGLALSCGCSLALPLSAIPRRSGSRRSCSRRS